jgi:type I restriction enzyme S subunit
MSLNLDKSTWKWVRLGDVIRRSRSQADPANGDVDRYVGGGHIDSDSLTIERFGDVNDGQMGSTFTYLFKPGQILFVSARPYLRKSGVVNFSGVVADKTYVLDALPENGLLQEFLPFLLASDHFIAYATAEATGSMNPRLLWGQMQRYEFALPPLDQQKRIADLMWSMEAHQNSRGALAVSLRLAYESWLEKRLSGETTRHLGEIVHLQHGRPVPSHLYGNVGVALLRPGDMKPNGCTQWTDSSVRIPKSFGEENADCLLSPGDLVINMTAQSLEDRFLGRVCRMHDAAFLNQRIGRLTPVQGITSEFLHIALRTPSFSAWVARRSEGSKVKHMHWRHIEDFPLPFPSEDVQAEIIAEAESWTRAMDSVAHEARNVSTLKQTVTSEIFGGAK